MTAWKTANPDAAGLYIASTEHRADAVRYWSGKHWTAPFMVYDLHLPNRVPTADWPAAQTWRKRRVEWLEAVAVNSDGWVSWGGLVDAPPLRPHVRVLVKLRSGARTEEPLPAGGFYWPRDRSSSEIVAYRIVDATFGASQ